MTDGGEGVSGYVYSNEQRRANSKRKKDYYENNPQALIEKSKERQLYCSKPETLKEMSERAIQQWADPVARQNKSNQMIEYYRNNPKSKTLSSERRKKWLKTKDGEILTEKCIKAMSNANCKKCTINWIEYHSIKAAAAANNVVCDTINNWIRRGVPGCWKENK